MIFELSEATLETLYNIGYKTILDNQTHLKIGGGMKQVFEKPSAKRKKMT